jgi:hypothetical protein
MNAPRLQLEHKHGVVGHQSARSQTSVVKKFAATRAGQLWLPRTSDVLRRLRFRCTRVRLCNYAPACWRSMTRSTRDASVACRREARSLARVDDYAARCREPRVRSFA